MVRVEQVHALAQPVVDAAEGAAAEDGPGDGVDADAEDALHLAHQLEGVASGPVQLVDEGEDGDGALPADAEELAGLRLDALGAVEQHDRPVDGVERPVGVLGEVGVAGGVEQVELQPAVGEGQHRGGDGDAALPLHLHPVGDGVGPPALGLDRAGQLDDAAVEQQLLGQRGLAGVGVRDDGEGAAAADLVLGAHVTAGPPGKCGPPAARAARGAGPLAHPGRGRQARGPRLTAPGRGPRGRRGCRSSRRGRWRRPRRSPPCGRRRGTGPARCRGSSCRPTGWGGPSARRRRGPGVAEWRIEPVSLATVGGGRGRHRLDAGSSPRRGRAGSWRARLGKRTSSKK